jgi:hypothetical protein
VYVLAAIAFLASVAIATHRVWHARQWWDITGGCLLAVSAWLALVTMRPMDPVTGTVALLGVDIALVAIGIAGSIRLLAAGEREAEGPGGWSDTDASPTPDDPDDPGWLIAPIDWQRFEQTRRTWELDHSSPSGRH